MNKSSHLLLGRLLCRRLEACYGIFLDEESSLAGCILPDMTWSFILRRHKLPDCHQIVLKKLENLLHFDKQASAFFGRSFSIELGIICHYYADFLCWPHASVFTGDISVHVRYEKALYQFLTTMPLENVGDDCIPGLPGEPTAGGIFGRFLALHDEYEKTEPSFTRDIVQSLRACMEVIVLVNGALSKRRRPQKLMSSAGA